LVTAPLSDGQFAALASFAFNLGGGNLAKSTLLKKLNAGDYAGAAEEFGRWVKSGGQTLPGLVARRAAETALFKGGAAGEPG
jgi:lysozyme